MKRACYICGRAEDVIDGYHETIAPLCRRCIRAYHDIIWRFRLCMPPLCGWDWLKKHAVDTYPEQWIEVKYDNKIIARVGTSAKRGILRKAIRGGIK